MVGESKNAFKQATSPRDGPTRERGGAARSFGFFLPLARSHTRLPPLAHNLRYARTLDARSSPYAATSSHSVNSLPFKEVFLALLPA